MIERHASSRLILLIVIVMFLTTMVGPAACVTINPPPAPRPAPIPTTKVIVHMSESPGGGPTVGVLPIYQSSAKFSKCCQVGPFYL